MGYEICDECKHFRDWETNEEEEYDGECRFNPPTPLEVKTGKGERQREYSPGHWPAVFEFSWCSKFEEEEE